MSLWLFKLYLNMLARSGKCGIWTKKESFWRNNCSSNPAAYPASYWPDWEERFENFWFRHCLGSGPQSGRIMTWLQCLRFVFNFRWNVISKFYCIFQFSYFSFWRFMFSKSFWAFCRFSVRFDLVVLARVGQAVRRTLWFVLGEGGAVTCML